MTEKRGEISVFLSLILVCILSLFLGLVESARTAGARLYLEMSADSAMASVMSQYNRNLWDMYHLLFLEAESNDAAIESFVSYLEFYLEQNNLYPMKLEETVVLERKNMTDEGGYELEQEILSYMKKYLPDTLLHAAGITEIAGEASRVGDFRELFDVCRSTGKRTRRLESNRYKMEASLESLRKIRKELQNAAGDQEESNLKKKAGQFETKVSDFGEALQSYQTEIKHIETELTEMKRRADSPLEHGDANERIQQEIFAYEQVLAEAREEEYLYESMEEALETDEEYVLEALCLLEETMDTETGNWEEVYACIDQVVIPESIRSADADPEKMRAMDRLEEIFQGDILELILEDDADVSEHSVRLKGIPSVLKADSDKNAYLGHEASVISHALIGEYCIQCFDSFLEQCDRMLEPNHQPLQYEQEYLLCGRESDRENLKEVVERILAIRGALNLLYLLQSSEYRAEADVLAAAISGGIGPVQFILSFFILTLWAFGEGIWDVKILMKGGTVPYVKGIGEWKFGLDEILALQFLSQPEVEEKENGNGYSDYLRVLFFMMDPYIRNYRVMDVIQWNVQTVQEDFLVEDCIAELHIQAKMKERHLFFGRQEYDRIIDSVGSY